MTKEQKNSVDSSLVKEVRNRALNVQQMATKSILSADVEGMLSSFSKEFSTSGGEFQFQSRDEFIRGVASGELKYEEIETTVLNVRVPNESTAIVVGKRHVKGLIYGRDFESDFSFKSVHTIEDGEMKVALWAITC